MKIAEIRNYLTYLYCLNRIKMDSRQYPDDYFIMVKNMYKYYQYTIVHLTDDLLFGYSHIYAMYHNGKRITDKKEIQKAINKFKNINIVYGTI